MGSSLFYRLAIFSGFYIHSYVNPLNLENFKALDPSYGETWMFYPDEKGNPHVIEFKPMQKNSIFRASIGLENSDSKISFWLYNQENKNSPIPLKTQGQTDPANFNITDKYDSKKKTIFLIHGFQNTIHNDAVQVIKNAYLNEKEDVNVIAVDWSELAAGLFFEYLKSAASTKLVGQNIANVIDFMVENRDANLDDFHLIGHSLGAHAAGFAGMYVKNGKIARITGLDPANPGFQHSDVDAMLDPSDAKFVDIIHTCSGYLGTKKKIGHADFWPNKGEATQPGCIEAFGGCSHGRSYQFYAESIETKNGFMAMECDSWASYIAKDCVGDLIPMGFLTPNTTKGNFFLRTTGGPKFARLQKINY